jgi:hypothetical protein
MSVLRLQQMRSGPLLDSPFMPLHSSLPRISWIAVCWSVVVMFSGCLAAADEMDKHNPLERINVAALSVQHDNRIMLALNSTVLKQSGQWFELVGGSTNGPCCTANADNDRNALNANMSVALLPCSIAGIPASCHVSLKQLSLSYTYTCGTAAAAAAAAAAALDGVLYGIFSAYVGPSSPGPA